MVLTFDGTDQWYDTSATGNLLVYQYESNIALLTGAIDKQYGQSILLKAQLTSEQQNPLEGRMVQFVICFSNGSITLLGENNTLADGTAQYLAYLAVIPGDYEWAARYCGSGDYGPAIATEFITIQKGATMLAGNNFEAIAESTSNFQITLYSQEAQRIGYVELSLFVYISDSWIFLEDFKTNALGQATMTMQIPASLGLHYLQIRFAGNDCYQSSYITLELTVIEAPPKIAPEIIAEVVYDEIFDHQFAPIEITIANAVPGASVLLYVFVDNELLESIIINDGFGIYYWSSPEIGLFNVTFIAAEDSVYLVATETIIVEVEQNIPPSIVSYYYVPFICEGEPFYFEVVLQDASGIDSAYLLLNGTQ
jgi:hypothetical protein